MLSETRIVIILYLKKKRLREHLFKGSWRSLYTTSYTFLLFFDDQFLVCDRFRWISQKLGRKSKIGWTNFSSNGFSTGSLHSDLNYNSVWSGKIHEWTHWNPVYFIIILIMCSLSVFRLILVITWTHIFLENQVFMSWSCLLFKH